MNREQFVARMLYIHNEHSYQDSCIADKDFAFESFQEDCLNLYDQILREVKIG